MHDPPHEEVIDAMKIAFEAHIKIVIITGDSPITATAIGRHIGLFDDRHPPVVIEHTRLKEIDDEEIKRIVRVNRAVIFSRVSPVDKLRIVRSIKSDGHVVAVTGDGVNDTLSLKEADIGVAMGARGSKVAQEAADFVLLDDNFSTIIDSVRKGRQIYTNIQNNIFSVLTGNFAELTCVLLGLGGTFGHMPLAIITIHILLIDCITEMLPLLALVYDPEAPGSMQQPPRNIHDHILKTKNLVRIALSGFFSGAVSFGCFLLSWWETQDPVLSQTVTFISISLCMLVAILSFRTKGTIFSSYSFSNPILTLCLVISVLLLIVICYVPICNVWFHTQGPGITQWYYILVAVMTKIAWHEGWKYFFMRNKQEN
jgi:Ca2+-transporting ATPase